MIERRQSLRQWAREVGVSPRTLKRWLAADLGMVMPHVSRGSKVLIRECDVEIVVRKRTAQRNWPALRHKTA